MLKICCNLVWEIEYENRLKIVVLFGSAMAVTIGIADVVLCAIRTCTRKGIKLPTIGKFLFNADSCIFCLCNKCFHACFVQDLPSDLASWTLQKSCYNFSSKGLGTKLLLLLDHGFFFLLLYALITSFDKLLWLCRRLQLILLPGDQNLQPAMGYLLVEWGQCQETFFFSYNCDCPFQSFVRTMFTSPSSTFF
jgi:hypothetical protein